VKWLFDLMPLVLFFVAYKVAGVYTATAVAIVATIAQVAWLRLRGQAVDTALWVSLGVVVVFGGATLLLHDEAWIKWKPTVLYLLLAGGLLVGQFVLRRNPMRAIMGAQIALSERAWHWVGVSWAGFFLLLAALNLAVARAFSTDTWVNFKLFGVTGLMLLFVFGQALVLTRLAEEASPAGASDAQDARDPDAAPPPTDPR